MQTLIVPKSKFLRQFIQYFFFIKNDDVDFEKTFTCYPNTNYCLGLHKGNEVIELSESKYKVISSNTFHSYLSGIYQKPMSISYSGVFNGVWINFEPLGLDILSGNKVSDNNFLLDVIEIVLPKKWMDLYELAFEADNPKLCAESMENFFLQNLPSKQTIDYLPFNKLEVERVENLKEIYNLSYRSIHRLYKNSLNITPKEFLNILRFRKSIQTIHLTKSLTDIAYDSGYSDQAHMIRNIRKYTNLSPKDLRNKSKVINRQLFWTTK